MKTDISAGRQPDWFTGLWHDGRVIAIVTIAAFYCCLSLSNTAEWQGRMWKAVGVPHLVPSFADTRTITHSLDAVRNGVNPYLSVSFDPWKRTFNYPRVWLLLSHLGIGARHTWIIGVSLGAGFYCCVLVLFRNPSLLQGGYLALVLLSPAAMCAVERGNIDLAIFMLLTFAVARLSHGRTVVPAAVILVAAILKLYPIFCVALLLSNIHDKRRCRAAMIIGAIFVIYIAITFGDLRVISRNTPKSLTFSYGTLIIPGLLINVADGGHRLLLAAYLLGEAALIGMLFLIWHVTRLKNPNPPAKSASMGFVGYSYSCGAILFLSTFALGCNWDYRLVVLIFSIPQLFQWLRAEHRVRRIAIAALLLLVITTYWSRASAHIHGATPTVIFELLGQVMKWCLAGTIFVGLLIVNPEWVRWTRVEENTPQNALN